MVGYASILASEPYPMSDNYQLLGISNAIVDVLTHTDHAFIESTGAVPGSMTLIDEDRALEVYEMMGPATEMSGGSVANTVAGFANLGGTTGYIGHVRDDQFGEVFNHDMRSLGVDIRLEPADSGAPTARCHIFITPDGQRTMQTYLGSCTELGLADISEATVGNPKLILLEGYVWDLPEGAALCEKAMQIAHANGASVAMSLSDSFCVERHRDAFEHAIRNGVDIVVADEDEIHMLLGTSAFDDAVVALKDYDNLFAITRSSEGSVILHGDVKIEQAATPIDRVIDSTGAGDAYTAGFLYGWASGQSLGECASIGTYCATRVIQQVGARIERGLLDDYA